ncbi:PREDICTED: uncharacterized protein LOC103339516 [Prunus mume]|uniref:Uncharacterized protein LOC103339516 n=1 Tax=Prunus mume TaxID=102107 RepID=A0ABM0PKR2_PRUMU|nr:PREDICTED: uncharacterized protein LOC103339516 [Prunus mume]
MEVQRKNDGKRFYCDGCGDPVLGPSYTCNICYEESSSGFDLHKSCAELTGEIHHPIHRKHPLTLDTSARKKSCSACHQGCISRFSYSCFQCQFNIDLQCASNWRNILDFHDHKFTLHRKPAQLPCEACGQKSVSTTSTNSKYGTAMYLCSICQLLVHGCCSRLPTHIKTAQHQHRLKLTWWFEDTFPKIQNFCDLCYKNMDKSRAVYYCEHECCSYVAHSDCATRRYDAVEDSAADDDDRIINNQIQLQIDHFSHPHVLALINSDHQDNGDDDDRIITCNGCMRPITKIDAFYSCTKQESCPFFLHTACAQSPKKMHFANTIAPWELHPRDHSIGGVFKCSICSTFSQGFIYLRKNIKSTSGVDLQCAILSKQKALKHEAHVHTLQFNLQDGSTYKCRGCGTPKKKYWFSCRRCNFHLCISCVKLPPTTRHKYDNHPLKLTYNSVKNELDEYYCEICEGKRDPELWFYSCSDCDFDSHPHCILGRYPQVKLGDSYKHPTHPHLVTLVDKRKSEIPSDKRERILPCKECSQPCEGLMFECSKCNINFHRKCDNDKDEDSNDIHGFCRIL